MKVLLLEDVYKLGRAGDVKKVADGYGRNYLIPQGLAVLATPGALKQVENIRSRATTKRSALNDEMSSVAAKLSSLVLAFPARAGETGKLYGSVTPQMIADAVEAKAGVKLDRRQVDVQPIRSLGDYPVHIRLTMDLVPEVRVLVYREGEKLDLGEPLAPPQEPPAVTEPETETEPGAEAELEAESAPEAD